MIYTKRIRFDTVTELENGQAAWTNPNDGLVEGSGEASYVNLVGGSDSHTLRFSITAATGIPVAACITELVIAFNVKITPLGLGAPYQSLGQLYREGVALSGNHTVGYPITSSYTYRSVGAIPQTGWSAASIGSMYYDMQANGGADGGTFHLDGNYIDVTYTTQDQTEMEGQMSAITSVREQVDYLARLYETLIAAHAGIVGDYASTGGAGPIWSMVDSADDETYENRVEGQNITNLDTAIANMTVSPTLLATWFSLHESYANADLSITTLPRFPALMAYFGLRVPERFATCGYQTVKNVAMPIGTNNRDYVFPKGIWDGLEGGTTDIGDNSVTRLHKFGSVTKGATTEFTFAEDDGDLTICAGAVVCVNNQTECTMTPTISCTNYAGGTAVEYEPVYSTTAANTPVLLGEEAVNSSSAAGQKNVYVADTSNFAAGDFCLITEGSKATTLMQEVFEIDSITEDTALVSKTNLKNTYTTSAKVYPLYVSVEITAATGTEGNTLDIYAAPDRTIEP